MKSSQWHRAVETKYIFSARLKALSDRSGDHSAGGRLFYMVGPLTAKLRWPVAVRVHGTSREPVATDDRMMLSTWDDSSGYAEVAEIARSNTVNTLPGHQGCLEDYSLTNRYPVQIFKNWGDVFTSGLLQTPYEHPCSVQTSFCR